jgi:hypothetical protein
VEAIVMVLLLAHAMIVQAIAKKLVKRRVLAFVNKLIKQFALVFSKRIVFIFAN